MLKEQRTEQRTGSNFANAEINDDRVEFEYVREDQGQMSTASLVAMRTNTTVQSLDSRLSYLGGQPLREKERRGSGVLMRRCPLVCERRYPAPPRVESACWENQINAMDRG